MDLLLITSEFHVARARHLFNVALRDVSNVEVLVLAVPNACAGATRYICHKTHIKHMGKNTWEFHGIPWDIYIYIPLGKLT